MLNNISHPRGDTMGIIMTKDVNKAMRKAFRNQRRRAIKQRNISWQFDFEQWKTIWLTGDRWLRRGVGANDLVMSRIGDVGPYSPGNVIIQTQAENGREYATRLKSAY